MPAKNPASARSLKSDLARVDAHRIQAREYEELPELNDDMLGRAVVNKGGRPVSPNPREPAGIMNDDWRMVSFGRSSAKFRRL